MPLGDRTPPRHQRAGETEPVPSGETDAMRRACRRHGQQYVDAGARDEFPHQ